jgi:hypothetical protein
MTFYTPLSEENEKILEEFGLKSQENLVNGGMWFFVNLGARHFFKSFITDEDLIIGSNSFKTIPIIRSNLKQFLIINLL